MTEQSTKYNYVESLTENDPHIYGMHLIEHNVVDHADSVTSSKMCVVLRAPMEKYQISSVLEKYFDIPYMKPVGGYAEMRPNNPYRVNHIYDDYLSFSLDVDNPKVFVQEFEQALSWVRSLKQTRFIVLDYDRYTNEYTFANTIQDDLITLLEQKLDKANRKVAFVQRKPVQQVLKKIKALSPQDRALLASYITDEQ